ncbi:MAG: 16S rRNA (guanine(966)-N(2))-methyltransferase RsmD [Mycoplasma sp.]|nr:16S rRNA (guanine(966)-N(2))-methyltransferase RsmD [Mycoplasma sp.]
MLRIIAGKYRSRTLEQPPLDITRPTLDRVRESLFNIIQNEIKNSIVLDCFAGSGAFCLEAISRGATKAIAIEKNIIAFEVINRNSQKLSANNIEIKNMDSLVYLLQSKNIKFDFIYLDPPYKLDVLTEAMEIIYENDLIKNRGRIIIETNIEREIKVPKKMMISDERTYGKTKLVFVSKIL